MQVYKITFSNNAIVACTIFYGRDIDGRFTYEHLDGNLIYALVKASSEEEAIKVGEHIVAKFKEGRPVH